MKIDIEVLEKELLSNGPILLWTGDGKIPGPFRGLTPQTLETFLVRIKALSDG